MKFCSVSPTLPLRSCEKLVDNKKDKFIFAFQKGKCIDEIYASVNSKCYHPPSSNPGANFKNQPNPSPPGFPRIPCFNKFTLFHHFEGLTN